MVETVNNPEQPLDGDAPGARLKAARKKAGYDLKAIARDTRITVSRLQALEEDDYDRVGSRIFVVGYIRQYAKWLGLSADDLVREWEARTQPDEEEEVVLAPPEPASRPKLPLLWLVVVLLVVWVVAAMVLSNGQKEAAEPAPVASPEQADEPEPEQAPLEGVEPDEVQTDIDSTPSSAEPVRVETGAAEVPRQEAQPDEPVGGDTLEPSGTDSLAMTFTGECWVEVRDADEQLLFAQLQEAGDNLRLSGQAPFSVVLGNARVASLEVNGRSVATDARPNRDTLRLKVGP